MASTGGAWYTVDADLDRSGSLDAKQPTWSLSSDDMSGMGHGMMRPGTTPHADWWGAWHDPTMEAWTANCIDKLLNCNGARCGRWEAAAQGRGSGWPGSPQADATAAG
jgi:hypothetical protein